jgi:uncharacterized protein Yka (UPF0111/DUF47 family)
MVAGARLDLTTDTRDIQKGFATVGEALEDVADSLDDVGVQGDATSDKLTRGFAEAARETKKDARDMAKGVNSSFDKMEKGSADANKKMASSAQSKSREVTASFDGSAESVVSGFQGAAAEMFEGFGPLGVAAGAAAAVGIGLITKEFQESQEEAAALAVATDTMVASMLESGSTYVTEQSKLNALEAFLGDSDARKEAEKFADRLGIDLVDFGSAMFGLAGDREAVEARINEYAAEQLETYRTLGVTGTDYLISTQHIRDAQEDALDLLYAQDKQQALAEDLAGRILGKRKDITGEIREEVDVAAEVSEEYRKMSRLDATPKLNIEAEANRQVAAAQKAINSLTGKDININVRVVQ